MDADIVGTIVVGFDGRRIVQVLGGSRIDGEDVFLSQVSLDLELAVGNTKRMK